MCRQVYFLAIIVVAWFNSSAQNSVNGTIVDAQTSKPIEFATIELIHLPDSTITMSTVTDKKGKFNIEKIIPGQYFIKTFFIGYSAKFSTVIDIHESSRMSIETFRLTAEAKTLSEVIVTGRKSQLNASIDRKIYNVEQDIMSRSGSVSDILKNIPSVEVDVEGNVSLRGSGDVMILINGKPNPMMGRTKAEVLQQLPANSVERIEVITNPSARYRPDGTSGIINIVLKKNIKNGFNGSLTGNAGNKERFNGNLSLNLKPRKYNLFCTLSGRKDTRNRFNSGDRTYIDTTINQVSGFFNQYTTASSFPKSHMVHTGIDVYPDEHNTFGASLSDFHWRQTRNDVLNGRTFNSQHTLIKEFDRVRNDPESQRETNGTVYYEHLFKKEDHEIRAELNIADEHETENNHYTMLFKFPSSPNGMENIFVVNKTRETELTVDYTNPLSEDAQLEAGYDGNFDHNDIDYRRELFDSRINSFVKDSLRSNRFVFNEHVHAAYLTYQKGFEKFGFELGLRGESVFNRGHLMTIDSFIRNNYFNLFPTLHLSYQISEQHELQLNYSKRINRPDGDELNPFPEYQEPRNLRAGNPKLQPEMIHSFELGYKWQHKRFSFVPSVYFRQKTHGFTSVVIPLNDSVLLTTTQNLSKDQSAGLELIFSYKQENFYTGTLSSNLFYNQIDATNLGYIKNKSIYSASVNLNNNFNISPTTICQVTLNYRSARLTPQGKTFPSVVVNSGFRQDLLKGKMSVTLTASDIFNSNRQKGKLDLPYLKIATLSKRDGAVIYLGLNWRFGVIKKQKEEKLEFDQDTGN